MKKITIIVAALVFVLLADNMLMAYPSGVTGRTKKTVTTGCGSCHSSNANVTGSITGPDTVTTGSTVTFTVTITRSGSNAKGGVDIAARLGTLAPGAGSTYLKLSSGELCQKNGLTLSGGTFTCQFSYVAPSATGIDTLWLTQAIGYSNGWGHGLEKKIVVRAPLGISSNGTPVLFTLNQNFPNPFNPQTTISFETVQKGNAELSIIDAGGRLVETLLNNELPAGKHEVMWNASRYASGIYFYRLSSGDNTEMKKMVLVK